MHDSPAPDLHVFLPWHESIARAWLGERARFAHAWLVHGAAGIGKIHFARAAAASLLCENPHDGLACGECQACLWLRHGNHPDFRAVRPDVVALQEGAPEVEEADGAEGTRKTPSREIRIEQVRGLESWANTATHRGGLRVALVYPANALNPYAANALLKLLEEPPAGTVFILVVDALDSLLPTLVSRCRRIPLPLPAADLALHWLREHGVDQPDVRLAAAGGAPMRAYRQFQSGVEACPGWLSTVVGALAQGRLDSSAPVLAGELEKHPPGEWLDALQRLFADACLLLAGSKVRYYPQLADAVNAMVHRFTPMAAAETFRWLAQQQRVANHPLNARLFAHMVLTHLNTLAR